MMITMKQARNEYKEYKEYKASMTLHGDTNRMVSFRQYARSVLNRAPDIAPKLVKIIGTWRVLVFVLVALSVNTSWATDPLPYFKADKQCPCTCEKKAEEPIVEGPKQMHPIAYECRVNDKACLQRHETKTLNTALFVHDAGACVLALDEAMCRETYQFIIGEYEVPKRIYSACTWIARIDGDRAQLLDTKTGVVVWVRAEENWKALTYVDAQECKRSRTSHASR